MVAHYMAQARGLPKVHFALEQPASPHSYMPETVSFWDTEEWKQVKEEFQLEETTFEQKSLGGPATKPTTIGGSLKIDVEDHRWRRGRSYEKVSSSKDLARWPPGLMHMIATALQEQVLHQDVQLKALSWQEHIAFNHIPYRRDCRVCQESLQQAEIHHRVRNPMGGILSLDVAGPMKPAYDQGGGMATWFLAGALTWRVPRGTDKMKQPIEEPLEEDAPAIEAAEEEEPEDQQPDEAGEGRGGREDPDQPPAAGEGRGVEETLTIPRQAATQVRVEETLTGARQAATQVGVEETLTSARQVEKQVEIEEINTSFHQTSNRRQSCESSGWPFQW